MTQPRYKTIDDAILHCMDELLHNGHHHDVNLVRQCFNDLREQCTLMLKPGPFRRTVHPPQTIMGGHAARHTDLVPAQPETPEQQEKDGEER